MPLEKRELSYLWDMRNAASEILEFMRGVKFSQFEKDKVKRFASERLLLIIGEAANQTIFLHNFVRSIQKSRGQCSFSFVTF